MMTNKEYKIQISEDKKSKKGRFILIAAILLVIGTITGFSLNQFTGESQGKSKTNNIHAIDQTNPSFFVAVDPITVNLRPQGNQQRFLKLVVRLETSKKKDEQIIKNYMPRIRDQLHVFLRELRVEDIEGSSGAYRIREELLSRINAVAQPAQVKDVLFDELLVQ